MAEAEDFVEFLLRPQQRPYSLGSGVRLGHADDGDLEQDLHLREGGSLCGNIGVADLALGRGEIGDLGLSQRGGVGQPVLTGADGSLHFAERAPKAPSIELMAAWA